MVIKLTKKNIIAKDLLQSNTNRKSKSQRKDKEVLKEKNDSL